MIRRFKDCFKCSTVINKQIRPNCHSAPLPTLTNLIKNKPNLTFPSKNLHFSPSSCAKLFVDRENDYAYNLLPEFSKIRPELTPRNKINTIEELDKLLDQNWRGSNASAIVAAFENVKEVCILNNVTVSDPRFNRLVDGLMDHCEKLTDEELLRLLLTFLEYPPCEASNSHNFHDIWSCLDDVCSWKMHKWDTRTLYTFVDVWYKWHLGRLSDFVNSALDRTTAKPQRLSKNMLLYTFFYLNVNRKKSVPFEFEHYIAERIEEFSLDELAVIAMGYFKTRCKIKPLATLNAIIKAMDENCDTIHEISLCAMLKVVRLSQRVETANQIPPLLDKLTQQIPRLSVFSVIHIALLGTSLQIKHELSIKKSTEKITQEIENVRVKDIERILLVCSMFNVDTTPSFFELASKEICKESRLQEFVKYNRCLPSTLNYLSLRNIYNYDLMSRILNTEYIDETYGKSSRNIPRDIFSLDSSIDIECPNYKGSRLPPEKKYKAAKWLIEFTPTPNQNKRHSLADLAYLDVLQHVEKVVGVGLLRSDHVLPHFSKSDIILCRDRCNGKFVEPFGFQNYCLGDVKRPFDVEKFDWFAVVVLTPNQTVREKCEPLGSVVMKERQLKAIGYTPIVICSQQFTGLPTSEKLAFIKNRLG